MANLPAGMIDHRDASGLSPCPFCGGAPTLQPVGNSYSKSRKLTVKCRGCRVQLTHASIRNNFNWLRGHIVRDWNKRTCPTPPASAQDDAKDAGARWYAIDKHGAATLCTDEEDARENADEAAQLYPHLAPYTAVQLAPVAAPAAGDALDAARLDWLEQHNGRFYNKDRISSIVGTGFLVAGDEHGVRHQTVRAAIDAAIAAQQGKGGEHA